MTAMPKPYKGLIVLDAAQGIAGPTCGMLLAACGATVIKLEPPAGDWSRGLTTKGGSQSAMHVAFNRGKRSLVLDLQKAEDQARLRKLMARADVVLEAFRPGVAKRIGIVPEAAKPDVVFLSISGFGQQGPYSERPCTDGVAQAFSGAVALNPAPDGTPHRTGYFVVDSYTGLFAFAAVQAGLAEQAQHRARGEVAAPRILDVSLMQSAATLLGVNVSEAGLLGRMPGLPNTPSGTYKGSCGNWMMIALLREPEYVQMCGILGMPELATDPRFNSFPNRFENRDQLIPLVRAAVAQRPVAEWLPQFHAARMLCDRVNTPIDWLADPHVQAVGAAEMLDQPELGRLPIPAFPGLGPWTVPAPGLGEHTDEVLAEFGL